ncbi:MAG: sugar transferase, partial [Chthoniobacteraceae bacterium]
MFGRRQQLNSQFLQIVDGLLLVLTFWGAHTFRSAGALLGFFPYQIPPFTEFQWLLLVLGLFGPISLKVQGFYEHPSRKNLGRSLGQLGRAALSVAIIIALCAYFLRLGVESRSVMPIFAFLATSLLLFRERITIHRYRRRVKSGGQRERVILVGMQEDILAFQTGLSREETMEIETAEEIEVGSKPVAHLVEALHRHAPDRVIFVGAHSQLGRLQEYIGACEIEGVEAWLSADFMQTTIARPDFDHFGARPMLVFRAAPSISWALMFKHTLDRVLA